MSRIKDIVELVAKAVISQRDYLNILDKAIGDGDHGNNMAIGFETALEDIENLDDTHSASVVLKTLGDAFAENVGGAAGPLYAIAFKRAGIACASLHEFTIDSVIIGLEAAISGIQKRGRAEVGDKTMLDVLVPVCNSFKESKEEDLTLFQAMTKASKTAKEAAEATKDLQAAKGRASYLGIRSIGHLDPGAVSSMIIIREFYQYFQR